MNSVGPLRVAAIVACAIALAFAGLHAALTASNWFAGYIVLPLLEEQENVRFYMLVGGHVAYIATSLAVGVALSYASAGRIWLGTVSFLLAVAVFAIDWERGGGSYFWALLDLPVVMFVVSSLASAFLVGRLRRTHAI